MTMFSYHTSHWQVVKRLVFSCFVGWAALQTANVIYVLVRSHDPHFAPEIGPLAGFILFGMVDTLFYIGNFVLLAIPCHFLFRSKLPDIPPYVRALCGAVLFILSVPVWSFLYTVLMRTSGPGPDDMLFYAVLGTIAGFSSFFVLTPSTRKGSTLEKPVRE